MDNIELIQQGECLRAEYHEIIDQYKLESTSMSPDLKKLLDRGVYNGAFSNPEGIVITGCNPSYHGEDEKDLPCNLLSKCTGRYWIPYVRIANSFPENMVGHFDVFPLRYTDQDKFLKIVPTELKVSLIAKFEDLIEDYLRPRLIIHTNKSTGYLWGTDKVHPWMGYELLPVEVEDTLSIKGKLYRIVGYNDTPYRIPKCGNNSMCGIIGTYLFITTFQQRTPQEKKINADDIHLLWNEYAYSSSK